MSADPSERGIGLHATAVVHGESGVLILGPTGSGKSALALALLARARSAGEFGALVGTIASTCGGRGDGSSCPGPRTRPESSSDGRSG